jgi:hypothetical protein
MVVMWHGWHIDAKVDQVDKTSRSKCPKLCHIMTVLCHIMNFTLNKIVKCKKENVVRSGGCIKTDIVWIFEKLFIE